MSKITYKLISMMFKTGNLSLLMSIIFLRDSLLCKRNFSIANDPSCKWLQRGSNANRN